MNKKTEDILSVLADIPILDWLWPWTTLTLISLVFSDREPNWFLTIGLGLLAIGCVMRIAAICFDKFKQIRVLKAQRRIAEQ